MGVPSQPAFQRQPLLETSTTRSPGRYTPFRVPFPADPQVSSIARAAKASTAEEFDRILSTAAAEEAPDDFDWLFRGLDVGVAGLTLVLSAAYYATCFSCRTHPSLSGDHMPQVIMAAEPQRVRVLAGYAARAGCGVENAGDGLVCAYAASVEHLHALAQAMLAARAELEELPQPSWRPRVQEYLSDEDSDEFEWTDDETG
jgi:hypothetical protein